MLGKRKSFRVKRSFYVRWTLISKGIQGEGKVSNMSVSGLDLSVFSTHYEIQKGDILLVEPLANQLTILESKKAKIVWIEKLIGGMQGYRCGLQFIEEKRND